MSPAFFSCVDAKVPVDFVFVFFDFSGLGALFFPTTFGFLVFFDFLSHCLRDVCPAVARLTILEGTSREREGNREGA